MKKLFIFIISFISIHAYSEENTNKSDAKFDFNIGLGVQFNINATQKLTGSVQEIANSASVIADQLANSQFNQLSSSIDDLLADQEQLAQDFVNLTDSMRYGLYLQLGAQMFADFFVVGVEFGLQFNTFQDLSNFQSSLIEYPLRAYIGFQVFDIIGIKLLIGTTFTTMITDNPKQFPSGYDIIKLDVGARVSVGNFFIEAIGALNMYNIEDLSKFRIGVGLEFSIF